MTFEQIIFYGFAAVLIAAAVGMVTVRNPVYAALCLILSFFTSAAIWLLLQAEFLGIVLVLVYVGAVMVLFLFIIMMLDLRVDLMREGFVRHLPLGIIVAAVITLEMILVLRSEPFQLVEPAKALAENNTEALGVLLYTDYVYPFEIAAVILVVAIIAAIVLTLRRRPDVKKQDISEQVQVRREDRVRLVTMKSEK